MSVANDDERLMDLALEEARRADFRTSPNPMVGCVVARDGVVVAVGHHEVAGGPHAETVALRAAGERTRGATLYLSLEPCTRQGRTPPCVDAVIATAPARAVVAMLDPNPRESGRGVQRMRDAGIDVSVGVRERDAARLVEFYAHHIVSGLPFVTAKFAASIDGHVATAGGESRWITSQQSRELAHSLRHQHDAVMVGAGTVVADDPLLTARIDQARQPLRVVVDTTLRMPVDAAMLRSDPGSVLIATGEGVPERSIGRFRDTGAEVVPLPLVDGKVDLRSLLRMLGGRQLISVLIEGGPSLLGSAFDAHAVQRVVAMLSPRVIGGAAAMPAVAGHGAAALADSPPLRDVSVERVGPDIVVTGYCVEGDV